MDYLAIFISLLALVGAGFAFLRSSSSHRILSKRIETLKDRNSALEVRLRKLEGAVGKGSKSTVALHEPVIRNQSRQEQQNEPRQKQPRQEQQNEPRQKQARPEQAQEPRQKQRNKQPRPEQQAPAPQQQQQQQQASQQQRKKENRRRNELMDRTYYDETGQEQKDPAANPIRLEIAGGDLLDELEQAVNTTPSAAMPAPLPEAVTDSGIRFAIIPEDGVIRQHHLQKRPDSDSYIEMDLPTDGSNTTQYRFNLAGNHAFVIAQGIDRLENAFDFEKPSNRMVSRVVQQHDGLLTKVNNGWKIQEKARIDFR